MEIAAAIVVGSLVVIALGWMLGTRLRARAQSLRRQRDKLESLAADHREMVARHESSAAELEPKAEAHREAAVDHERRADELEERIERERRQAQFHEERAAETEDEREHI
jgi:biopolymer transport protein ExbB/TolQ